MRHCVVDQPGFVEVAIGLIVGDVVREAERERGAESAHRLEVDLRTEIPRPVSAARALEVVGAEVRHYGFPIVTVDGEPGRDVRILANRRTATRETIVVRLA